MEWYSVILSSVLILWIIGGVVSVIFMNITPAYRFKGTDYFVGFVGSWLTLYALTKID